MDSRTPPARPAAIAWTRRHWVGLAIDLAGAAWLMQQALRALAG
jgi:hypothetical protein